MARCLSTRRSPAAALPPRSGRLLRVLALVLQQQAERLPVPVGPGIILSQHRRGLVGLDRNSEREIRFYQPLERLGRMAGGLIMVDDLAEAQSPGEPVARALVETSDLHLLAGEMVVDEVELEPR